MVVIRSTNSQLCVPETQYYLYGQGPFGMTTSKLLLIRYSCICTHMMECFIFLGASFYHILSLHVPDAGNEWRMHELAQTDAQSTIGVQILHVKVKQDEVCFMCNKYNILHQRSHYIVSTIRNKKKQRFLKILDVLECKEHIKCSLCSLHDMTG